MKTGFDKTYLGITVNRFTHQYRAVVLLDGIPFHCGLYPTCGEAHHAMCVAVANHVRAKLGFEK